jgi:twinkle protein
MILQQTIDEVKAATKIVEVIGDFITLKKRGADYIALCPFHNEKTSSFTVSPVKEIYKCFGCGKTGDAISFLVEHQKLDYIGAIAWLSKKYAIEMEEQEENKYSNPLPRLEKISKKSIEFFEGRNISNNTLLRFGITESREFMSDLKQEASVICFNYFRDEQLVNIKFRGPKKSFKLEKNAELIFYNIDSIKDEKEVVIVEGEIDCLSMYECGIYNAVSVPNGASKGKQNLKYLDNCWQYFEGKEKIILAVDNDQCGELLREELGRRLGKERCYLVSYPEDKVVFDEKDKVNRSCKDANEVLMNFGKETVLDIIKNAKQWPLEGIILVEDLYEEIVNFYVDGYPQGAKAHIAGIDDHISFVPGQMTTITGIPGSGKDEIMNYISVGLARYENWKFGICAFEEPPSVNVTKLQEKLVNKAFAFRKNTASRMDEKEFQWSLNFVKDHFWFINIEQVGARLELVLEKAADLVKRVGINALILNPWNCFEHNRKDGMSETEYVSACMTMINNFDVKYGVHTFLIAHPTKINKKKDTGKYEVPTLYQISGSAHFFNKTFNGISVYRNFETNVTDIYFQKIKWYWLGKIGFVSFNFNTETRHYTAIYSPKAGLKQVDISSNGHAKNFYETEKSFDDSF